MQPYNLPAYPLLFGLPKMIPVKKIQKAGMVFLLLLLNCFPLMAQDTLDFTTYLVFRMVEFEQLDSQEKLNWKPTWINDIEVRTETDRFDPDRQEYLTRFNFNSFGLMKAQKKYFASLQEKSAAATAEVLGEFVQKSYKDWLEAVFAQKMVVLLLQRRSLLADEALVRQKMVDASEKDLDNFLALRNEIREEDLRLQASGFRIKIWMENSSPVGFQQQYAAFNEHLLTVEQIESFVNRLSLQSIPNNPVAENSYQTRLNTLEKEQAVEWAENRQIVNFVQLRYSGPHADELNERLSASIGLRVPLNGRNRLKTAELSLEMEELKQKRRLDQYTVSRAFEQNLDQIRLLFDQYRLLQQQSDGIQEEYETVASRVNTSSSPIWLLDLKKNLNKTSLRQLEVSREIYAHYIELLALTGRFRRGDMINYLARAPEG